MYIWFLNIYFICRFVGGFIVFGGRWREYRRLCVFRSRGGVISGGWFIGVIDRVLFVCRVFVGDIFSVRGE